jgi:tetratricopeptide (TPR) repeat protein
VVQSGWAGLEVHGDDVLTVGAVPHEWLLPRAAAVVHHCGAGTTAAALRAGVPTVPVPVAADQPFWAARQQALGVCPAVLPARRLTRSSSARSSPSRKAPMPASVRDAVLARTAGLAPAVRRCLELLSCTPEPVGPELLDALGVSTETVGLLAATGLIDRHGRAVAFRHEIARSAILGAAVPGSEPALHAAMIDALEAIGADLSVLAHHAAAAGDVPRMLRYAPAAAAEASRSGAHREAVAFYEAALRHVGDDAATRATLLEAMSLDLYLTDRLRDAIAARERAVDLRRDLGEVVAVGAGHTALAGFAWYAADRALAEWHARAAIEILGPTDDRRALGFALARHAFLAAQRGDTSGARRSGDQAARIADELGEDTVLRGTASIGVAVARLLDGDPGGRAELLAATEVGLRYRLDDLATTPMSNLCHLDVQQGRFAEAEESVTDALRISEERDTPPDRGRRPRSPR